MSRSGIAAVILAAGKSKRMKSALPKAAHLLCGKPITRHVIDACLQTGADMVAVVIGHQADRVKEALGSDVTYAYQKEQLGTGHAVLVGLDALREDFRTVMVLPGDAPLITARSLAELVKAHQREQNAATLLTVELPDAGHYGRILRAEDGRIVAIVEAKDASPEILSIREICTSIYAFQAGPLRENLASVKPENAQGEYYLTDVIGYMARAGLRVGALIAPDASEGLGINTRVELAEAARIMRERIMRSLMLSGVSIVDPTTTCIDVDVEIGEDSTIMPFTIIERGSRIGKSCIIGPFVRLAAAELGDGASVQFANIDNRGKGAEGEATWATLPHCSTNG